MTLNRDQFWAELDELGEDEVRGRFASERVYDSGKRPLVQEWLRRKDQERKDALNREQIEIARDAAASARDAADSARAAANEAQAANKIAKIAIAIAAIAAIIAIVS